MRAKARPQVPCGMTRAVWALMILGVFISSAAARTQTNSVLTVSAAASLTDALQEIESAFRRAHPGVEVRNNLGSSGTLAREIEEGAPVDVFLSAAAKPMDELEAQHLIVAGTRRNLLRNTLVLIAPRDSHITGFQQLSDRSVRRIAIGDPASVPAGQYGKQTLIALHLLDGLRSKLVLANDVRQVLAYVETGNADAGLVYSTDAMTSHSIRIVAVAPESTHDAIVYPAAVVAHGHNEPVARSLVEFLSTPVAKAIFTKHGFTVTEQ